MEAGKAIGLGVLRGLTEFLPISSSGHITLFQTLPGVDAGLAASIFHFGEVEIADLKREMRRNGISARLV